MPDDLLAVSISNAANVIFREIFNVGKPVRLKRFILMRRKEILS
jgi:hypothetical protein